MQILALTEEILKAPRDLDLYLKRGELNRLHQLYDAAMADFDMARSLSTNSARLDLAQARLFLDTAWPLAAKVALDRFVAQDPDSPEGYTLRARAFFLLEKPLEAAEDYNRAIRHHISPGPELYIDRARALEAAGEDHFDEAMRGLDEGIKALGPLVTLQLPAIELERKRKRYDAALARLDKVASMMPRQETWLKRRGEILLEAGKPGEARAAFQKALEALRALPASRRYVPAMVDLEKSLSQYLETTLTPTNHGSEVKIP